MSRYYNICSPDLLHGLENYVLQHKRSRAIIRLMNNDILKELIQYLEGLQHIDADEIPSISLYMDQVTAFMDEHLRNMKRHDEDKALTKTMINNYAKNKLLPPPVKKRYSREHMLMLLFIYYYKGILSLTDIETILKPLNEKYFSANDGASHLQDIYEEVFSLEDAQMDSLIEDVKAKFVTAGETFRNGKAAELSPEDREELQLFAFLCELGFDVYLKRQLMEKIVDHLQAEENRRQQTETEKHKKK